MATELYFKHSVDARKHISIYQLEKKFGKHLAYSYYFKTLELMSELSECGLLKESLLDYAEYLQIDHSVYNEFIEYCLKIELFTEHNGLIIAERLVENMRKIVSKSINMSKAAQKREKQKAKLCHSSTTILPQPEQKHDKAKKPNQLTDVKLLEFVNGIIQKGIDEQSTMKSNLVCLLTDEHIKKLIDEYGQDMLYPMCQVFYKWKITAKKKIKSDYLSMIKDWVIDKAKTVKVDIPETKSPEQIQEREAKRKERLKELGVVE